jgi:hypothetical protein
LFNESIYFLKCNKRRTCEGVCLKQNVCILSK